MLNRFTYIFLLGLLAMLAFLYIHYSRMSTEGPQQFTSVERCRVCHEAASAGAQFKIWQRSPHAAAYTILESDSARAYLSRTKLSVDSCLACHTTLGRPAANDLEMRLVAEGVGCERCHGPGSNYSYYNTMREPATFKGHGGVAGSLDDCYQCHAASVGPDTRHCPFQTTAFNADTAWKQIAHPVKNDPLPDTVLKLRE